MQAALTSAVLLTLLVAYTMQQLEGLARRIYRNYMASFYAKLKQETTHTTHTNNQPLRIGLLGVAKIAPFALLHPAHNLQTVISVLAVGARNPSRAKRFAERWSIPHHGDYLSVLSNPDIDAVYVALVSGLHYEWAAAALRAGKHVLCEKPLSNNADEARSLDRLARSKGLVLAEAFHWAHHPAAHRVRQLVTSGELGHPLILNVTAGMPSPDSILSAMGVHSKILPAKMNYALGGGNFMGQGCYTVSVARFFLGEPTHILMSEMVEGKPGSRADVSTRAKLAFSGGVVAELRSSALSLGFNLHLELTKGKVSLINYLFPHIYHRIEVETADGYRRVEKAYGNNEATFELQLAAFYRAVRGHEPFPLSPDDSVANAEIIDKIYELGGLGIRPSRGVHQGGSVTL